MFQGPRWIFLVKQKSSRGRDEWDVVSFFGYPENVQNRKKRRGVSVSSAGMCGWFEGRLHRRCRDPEAIFAPIPPFSHIAWPVTPPL